MGPFAEGGGGVPGRKAPLPGSLLEILKSKPGLRTIGVHSSFIPPPPPSQLFLSPPPVLHLLHAQLEQDGEGSPFSLLGIWSPANPFGESGVPSLSLLWRGGNRTFSSSLAESTREAPPTVEIWGKCFPLPRSRGVPSSRPRSPSPRNSHGTTHNRSSPGKQTGRSRRNKAGERPLLAPPGTSFEPLKEGRGWALKKAVLANLCAGAGCATRCYF